MRRDFLRGDNMLPDVFAEFFLANFLCAIVLVNVISYNYTLSLSLNYFIFFLKLEHVLNVIASL